MKIMDIAAPVTFGFKKACLLPAAICLAIGLLAVPAAAQAQIVANGSFETGDYTGWTLFEGLPGSSVAQCGTWGIGQNGQTINQFDTTFDFFDEIFVQHFSITAALPLTFTATDGNFVAYQLPNCTQTHRMSQAVQVCGARDDAILTWDMQYQSNVPFRARTSLRGAQELAVEIRDLPGTTVLATLFTTRPANPTIPGNPLTVPLQNFSADISAFAGQSVQLHVDMQVNRSPLAAYFDNFKIQCIAQAASADLSITKTDDDDPVLAGKTLTYTVEVVNAGPDDAENVVVSDALPASVTFVGTSGCDNDPTGVPTCQLGTIVSGSSKSYTITVTVDATTAAGTITNAATVTSDADDPVPADNDVTEDTIVIQLIDIDIKPGSFPNSINLGSGGTTPVAVLGSAILDVNTIDIGTLTLASAGNKTVGKTDRILCSVQDVSGDFSLSLEGAPDGFPDLVCHFITVELVPELVGATEAALSGNFTAAAGGGAIEGPDSVNIVP